MVILDTEALFATLNMMMERPVAEAPAPNLAVVFVNHGDDSTCAERVEAKSVRQHENCLAGSNRLGRMEEFHPSKVEHLPR